MTGKLLLLLTMVTSLTILSANSCDDGGGATKGSKGGACYSNNTCDEGLVCMDDECSPESADGTGDNGEEGLSLDDAHSEIAEVLCDRMIICYGDENVVDDCEDELVQEFSNAGCKNYDSEQTDPCIECLDEDLDCTEVEAILFGSPLGDYCNVCNLMCD